MAQLRDLPYEELGFAKIDHHRALRRGFPEVIFGPGKSAEQIVTIAQQMVKRSDSVLVTKVSDDICEAVCQRLPDAQHHPAARAITIKRSHTTPRKRGVLILSGGTADIPVAEEAAVTAELMGYKVQRCYDVGVAGVHRLLDHLPRLQRAKVIIAVAGMEGALPSVASGLVSVPVIAVPTSVGYGASFNGLAALLGMLNSCSAGVSVVNIDNGFGAGYLAARIIR